MRRLFLAAAATLALWLSSLTTSLIAQPLEGGPELRVDTIPAAEGSTPTVAAGVDGSFLVVWDSSTYGASARRIDRSGAFQSDEVDLGGTSSAPSMGMDRTGGFVVVWSHFYGLGAQRFDRDGEPLGADFGVFGSFSRFDPSDVAMTPEGAFVVAFTSYGRFVGAQRFDTADGDLGFSRLDDGAHSTPAVAADAAGNHVVVWTRSPDGAGGQVRAQRFTLRGDLLGGQLEVSTGRRMPKASPDAAMAPDGSFVVVWESAGQDGDGSGVFAQRFDDRGRRVGGELRVNSGTTGDQVEPAVAIRADGSFFVAWTSRVDDGSSGISGRHFDAAGNRAGSELRIDQGSGGAPARPDVAIAPDGSILVVWAGRASAGTQETGIFARLFVRAGSDDADSDGLVDRVDNCPTVPNPDQADANADGFGDDCVAPDVVIPPDARIGANPRIGQGTILGGGVSIGDDVILGENVRLAAGVSIGARSSIGDFVVVGARTRLGRDVTIGGETRLERVVVIGNAVRIGDRVDIRRNAVVADGASIEPLVVLFAGVFIGEEARVETGATVGRRAIVSPGAVVPAGTSVPPRATVR